MAKWLFWNICITLCAVALVSRNAAAQGIMLSASGPVNQSMGGAAVAAPLEAMGAIRWNPATIRALGDSQLGFGVDLVWADVEVDSSIAGLGGGTTSADANVSPIPTVGWVHHLEDSRLTIGLGLQAVAGFKTNYPGSLTNPILTPQSNRPGVPGGLGRVFTAAQFFQILPTMAFAMSDKLSVGVSPIVTLGEIAVDPMVFTAPNDADRSGAPRFPPGRGSPFHWGLGVQVGAYYIVNDNIRVGAAIKSPDWMERFRFNSEDELGRPFVAFTKFDLPMIISLGASYTGFEKLLLAADIRYFDYKNTDGFGDQGFTPDGALRGLGWNNIVALALGAQYRLTDNFYARGGYTFNDDPTPATEVTAAVAAPLHYQHQIHVGGSYQFSDCVWLNLAYTHWLEHAITGPIVTAAGAIPDSSVTSREFVHIASMGIQVNY